MRASKLISGQNRNCVAILQLQPSTVYRLAAKGTPAGVVDSVIERGERGEVVSDKQVLAALDEVRNLRRQEDRQHKPKPLSKGQIARREKRHREFQEDEKRRADAAYDAALTIIAEIGTVKTKFVLDIISSPEFDQWRVLDELRRQVGGSAQ
jgi:hypothetical protein